MAAVMMFMGKTWSIRRHENAEPVPRPRGQARQFPSPLPAPSGVYRAGPRAGEGASVHPPYQPQNFFLLHSAQVTITYLHLPAPCLVTASLKLDGIYL